MWCIRAVYTCVLTGEKLHFVSAKIDIFTLALTPSLSQAQRMKRMSQEGKLTEDIMLSVMSEQKKPEVERIVFTGDTLRKYFPRSYTPKKMEETIINLLEGWMKKRQRSQER